MKTAKQRTCESAKRSRYRHRCVDSFQGGIFDSLPKSPATFQDVIKWKEESHEKVVSQIEEVGEAHLIEAVEFFGQEMPRLGILNFLLAHEIHHRGQLSVYVRGAGGLVPSIYGGSADEPMKS